MRSRSLRRCLPGWKCRCQQAQEGDVGYPEVTKADALIRPSRAVIATQHCQNQFDELRSLEEGHISGSSSVSNLTSWSYETGSDLTGGAANPRHNVPGSLGTPPLPAKRGTRGYRYLRWNFGSVYRRIFTIAFLANIATIAVLGAQALLGRSQLLCYSGAVSAVAANLLAALLVRNEHVVNSLFLAFGTWPRRWPLPCRRILAKVYCYGGIHSGCGVAATFWYVVFLALLTVDYMGTRERLPVVRVYILVVSYAIVALLLLILALAHPRLRVLFHNSFELTHRFAGWTVVLLFWAQVLLMTCDSLHHTGHGNTQGGSSPATSSSPSSPYSIPTDYGAVLVATPAFWMLVCITLLVIYPWTRLRLRKVEVEPLSERCVKLNFDYTNAHYGQAVRLTDAPLKETHAFAIIPNPALPTQQQDRPIRLGTATGTLGCPSERAVNSFSCEACESPNPDKATIPSEDPTSQHPGSASTSLSHADERGFSVVVSDAGDWTRHIIAHPSARIYTRGIPQFGVLRVAGLFSPVVLVATGSGIAPCLSLLAERPEHPVRIVWSAPAPLRTYGRAVLDTIYRADPGAVVIDTRKGKGGRPDLVAIAHRVWRGDRCRDLAPVSASVPTQETGRCEAVVVISNQKVTRKVVYGLESRGVPAFGPIFDS